MTEDDFETLGVGRVAKQRGRILASLPAGLGSNLDVGFFWHSTPRNKGTIGATNLT